MLELFLELDMLDAERTVHVSCWYVWLSLPTCLTHCGSVFITISIISIIIIVIIIIIIVIAYSG
jgi:hypothetical protein